MSYELLQKRRKKSTVITFIIMFLALFFSSGESYAEITFTGLYGGAVIAGIVYLLFSIFIYLYLLIRR